MRLQDALPVTVRQAKGNIPQVVGVISAGVLVRNFVVPFRDSRRKQGYQRPVSQTRVNKLATDLRSGRVDLPTAVLLNIRGGADGVIQKPGDGMTIFHPNGRDLYVVDGQHRIAALAKLVEQDPDKWQGYQVPFVCMIGATEMEEMRQFYVVNSTAKSVRTDLALDLLKQQAENDPDLMASLVEKGESWKVEAQTITEQLAPTRLWRHRIRFPGDPAGETTIGSGRHGGLPQADPGHAVLRRHLHAEPGEDPRGVLGGSRAGYPGGVQGAHPVRDPEEHRRADHARAARLGA